MRAIIEKIDQKNDNEGGTWIELRVVVYRKDYRTPEPKREYYIQPCMEKNGVPVDQEYFNERMQEYVKRYGEWEKAEIDRIQHNNTLSRLRLGEIEIFQDLFTPQVIVARPQEINKFLLDLLQKEEQEKSDQNGSD